MSLSIVRLLGQGVALRKESVDRNAVDDKFGRVLHVALRKESVDRNYLDRVVGRIKVVSLSARRAWIEMIFPPVDTSSVRGRSPQGERG